MSTKGTLSRDQAIAQVGLAAVEVVEGENCDFTNRVQPDGDSRIEFSASADATDQDGDPVTLVAYYYQEQSDVDAIEQELEELEWKIHGFEVE